MGSKISHPPPKEISNQMCIHYWRIEVPDGRKSMGVCKYCGEEKEFTNSLEDMLEERKAKRASDKIEIESNDLPV